MSELSANVPLLVGELAALKRAYFAMEKELRAMEKEIRALERRIESECDHNWVSDDSARGGRSYHCCAKCGAYR